MAFGDGGRVTAMDHHAAAGWPTPVMAPAFMPRDARGVPYDLFAIYGADHWYTVGGAHRQAAVLTRVAEKAGWVAPSRKMSGSALLLPSAKNEKCQLGAPALRGYGLTAPAAMSPWRS